MSKSVLIIGASGSGKSTAIRTLNPSETYIINVLDKPLPIKGYKKNYKPKENYFASSKWDEIIGCSSHINENRPEIKNLIIDDFQYIMATEFMNNALVKGYDKFSELAQHSWMIINHLLSLRDDLVCFILSHNDTDSRGFSKMKTIGKLLEEKVTLEGMFTTVFHTRIIDGNYKFMTKSDGEHLAKAPMGMFDEPLIDNDLQLVRETLINYYEE